VFHRKVVIDVTGDAGGDRPANAPPTGEQHDHRKPVLPNVVKGSEPAQVNTRLGRIGASTGFSIDRIAWIEIRPPGGSVLHRPHHAGPNLRNKVADVEAAFRTIIRWTGDDPERDGLIETPARVARALEEFFVGYAQDPVEILQKTFEEIEGYDEMIVLRGIRFESHCEHHMAPIIGQAWVGYVPSGRVVGISKLARVVEVYAKRLQIQEKMTAQIANTINDVLKPQGVGVIIKASHHCMTTRGIHKPDSDLVTSRMLGCFRENPLTRQEFLSMAA